MPRFIDYVQSARSRVSHRLPAVLSLALLAMLGACTDTPPEPDGKGFIRGVHAISDLPDVVFLIEGVSLGQAAYQTVTPYSDFDALQYDFHFDYQSLPTETVERLGSTSVNVSKDTNYTLVLAGTPQAPQVLRLERPRRVFDAGDTILELTFAHLSRAAPSVDLYFGAEGFDPAAGMPLVSGLARYAFSATLEVESGAYEFVATAVGDPATILFRSEPARLTAGDNALISLMDAANQTNGDYVMIVGGDFGGARLVDQAAPTEIRLLHAAATPGNVDLYVNDETLTPAIGDLPFAAFSAPTAIPAADDAASVDIDVTQAGNVGVIYDEITTAFVDGSSSTLLLFGSQADDTLTLVPFAYSNRAFFDSARLSVANASNSFAGVRLFLVPSDSTFEDSNPLSLVAALSVLQQFSRAPDDYDLYLTDNADSTLLAGPIDLPLAAGEVVQLVIVDGATPGTLDVLRFD